MSRTVTAFFDSRAEAEQARQRLSQSSIDADRVRIIDKNEQGSGSTGDGGGFWSSLKDAFLPDEDRHAYGEGINRGGFLLCAEVDENEADEAIRILDQDDAVDFDQRQDQWRSEGWSGYDRSASTAGSGLGAGSPGGGTAGLDTGTTGMQSGTAGLGAGTTQPTGSTGTDRTSTVAEEHIPIVEEELRIGKREVNRGGARVRSYVREVPVHEQVSLREEHVSVERRPVNERLSSDDLNAGDLLRDRTIEMTETSEEAVVAKEAHVSEEVVVRKTAEERVEQIDDTVRRTEVDVDEGLRTGGEDRSAFFGEDENRTGGAGLGGGSGLSSGSGTPGSGATGYDSREPQREGTGYTDRIDKSGL